MSWDNLSKRLIDDEGRNVVKDDAGKGLGRYGILQSTYTSLGYPGANKHGFSWPESVENLTEELAKVFYYYEFYTKSGADKIKDEQLAFVLLSLSVNTGIGRPLRWLQSLVDYNGSPLVRDGVFGTKTEYAINNYSFGFPTLVKFFKQKAETYYRALVKDNPSLYTKYLDGWLKRLEKM